MAAQRRVVNVISVEIPEAQPRSSSAMLARLKSERQEFPVTAAHID